VACFCGHSSSTGQVAELQLSSVAQILLEEEFRTRAGLESLIPSNWMSLGFPFSRSFTLSGHAGLNCSPVFLAFLDCLHQFGLQIPSSLEFTEVYLVDMWSTALFPIFDTFIFDCEHDRVCEDEPGDPLPATL